MTRIIGLTVVALVAAAVDLAGAGGRLIDAIKAGNREAVRALVKEPAEVASSEADGTTPLHWAVRADDLETVRLLLAAGAPADAPTRHGITPLSLAAVNGSVATTETLLKAGANPNAVLPEGETILMTAARTGSADVLKLLLGHGADVHARESWFGETALMWAAAENHPAAVRVLVEHGADVNGRSTLLNVPRRRSGQSILPLGSWTPLMYAARQNAVDATRTLVELGADVNLVDPDGATALVLAIINANYDVAALLVDKGANPNIGDTESKMAALYAAIDMHRLALGEGSTPFMRAAKSGDAAVMRLLLAAGADPKLTQPNGANALMLAAGLGWRDGSPAAPSYDQGSERDAIEAITLCMEAGLDINATTTTGETALHAAVSGRGSDVIVRFLAENGANLHARNKQGRTPLDAATASRRERSAETVKLLKQLMNSN